MTKSVATPTPVSKASKKVPQSASPDASGWGRFWMSLIFRLLLLGIGGSLATVVGIAAAQLFPEQTKEIPVVEKLLHQAQNWLEGEELPLLNLLDQTQNSAVKASPAAPAAAPANVSAPVSAVPGGTVMAPLTDSERQQIQTELTQLQAELQTLTSQSAEPLAERVGEIQKRIQAAQVRLNSFTAPAPTLPSPSDSSNSTNSGGSNNALMVTLPSDALFTAEQTTLQPEKAILDSIVADLRGYPEAAIQVGAHTDPQDASDQSRTLEQAKAVQQYLSTQLGSEVHWSTIGYGHHHPIASNDSPDLRQRNRRIEITISPK